jgi:predicted amidophosphoribosyltransferase
MDAGWYGDGEPALLAPRPAGFPHCRRCPYDALDRPDVCLACVGEDVSLVATGRCPVCEQALEAQGGCDNDWCSREDRWFSLVWSVASHVAGMRSAIARYKFRGELFWAPVFARLLVGYLDEHMPWFDEYDVLVPMPAYVGPGAQRGWDHVGLIVVEASRLAGLRWPIATDALEKTGETPAMTGRPLAHRRATAEGPLRRVLRVTDPASIAGARILVVDDVFTEGSTLREAARTLRLAGAEEVAGLALIRQPWSGRRGGSRMPSHSP